jgi:hypothetical protein
MTDANISTCLSTSLKKDNHIPTNNMKATLKVVYAALLALLNLTPAAGKETIETEISDAQLSDINSKLEKLADLESQVATLTIDKKSAEDKVSDLQTQLTAATTKATDLQTQLNVEKNAVTDRKK